MRTAVVKCLGKLKVKLLIYKEFIKIKRNYMYGLFPSSRPGILL